MRNKLIILGILALLATSVAADDYIIQDSSSNPLFVVNQTGEKQIQNGNLYLNGNSIIDNSGALTLGGGKVNVANGGLTVNDSGGSDSLKVQSNYGQLNLVETDESDKMWRFEVTNRDFAFTEAGVATYIKANAGGPVELTNANVRISDGNLQMNGNEIQNVGALQLGWKNLTDYPAGCASDEAVQVVGDTIDCTALNPGGTVNTSGADPGEVAYFIDNETVTGSSNFYWNNSQTRLGLGTNNPSTTLDVNGGAELAGNLDLKNNNLIEPDQIQTGGGGSDTITVRDTNNGQDIARFNEGGNLEIPNGNLGVGTSNPGRKLAVNDSDFQLRLHGSQNNRNWAFRAVADSFIIHDETAAAQRLRINSNGNIGLGGDLTPDAALETVGGLMVSSSAGGDGDLLNVGTGGNVEIPNGGLDIANPSNGGSALDVGGKISVDSGIDSYGNINIRGNDIQSSGTGVSITSDTGNNYMALTDGGQSGDLLRWNNGNGDGIDILNENLDMNGLEIENVDALGNGTARTIELSSDGDVRIPNGNLKASQGIDVGSVGVASSTGEITVANGLAFSNNAVSINRGTRSASSSSLVLDSYEDTLIYSANGAGNIAWFRSDGDVEIPNGALDVSGQLTVGSTECSTGEYIDGDGTCTSVSGSTSDKYVDEAGDTMSGDLNMNNSNIDDVASIDGGGDAIQVNDNFFMNNNAVDNAHRVKFQGPGGEEGILWSGTGAEVTVAPLDNSNNDGYLQLVNDEGIAFEPGGDSTTEAVMESNGRLGLGTTNPQKRLDVDGDVRVRGDLDIWGNITNTNVNNLLINGSLYPPSGYSGTFDVGSSTRQWRDAHFSGDVHWGATEITEADIDALNDGIIQNSELANSGISTSTNSGISAGSVNLGGTLTIDHADTSSQADVDVSGGTVVQDVLVDGFGHAETIRTKNLDNRYYTESESDSNFVDVSGDSMIGNLNMSRNRIYLEDSTVQDRIFKDGSGRVVIQDADTGYFRFEGSTGITVNNADLDLGGNNLDNPSSITNYFDSDACPAGEVVADIGDDGTFNCVNTVEQQSDVYVNESGDMMEGNLDFAGYDIQNAGTINGSILQQNGNDISSIYVDEGGDSMSGHLNMQDHHIDNIAHLEMNANSIADIRTDGVDAIRIDGNQNVDIPNGNLDVSNRVRVNNEVSYEGQRVSTSAVGDWSVWDQQNSQEIAVFNEGGDVEVPNGRLRAKDSGSGWAEMYHGGSRDEAYFNTDWGGFTFNTGDGTDALHVVNGGDVSVPNGDLTVNNQLTVGSTECSTGYYIDGDGTCTSVTGETSSEYVDESGDTMTGDLDMNYNAIGNVSRLNVSTSTDQIAEFTDTGVTLSQPLSVESSGPLSVANGIDLTGSSSNTIDSYSTMYLQTSSGSPSDIVLDPTGDVGIDSNASIVGDLDMQNGAITNVDWSSSDNPNTDATTKCSGNNVFLDGSGTCRDITTDYGNVLHGNLIQANTIDNSEIQNGNSFTFGGITSNGNLDMSNNQITNVGDGMTVGNNGIINSDTYAKLETGGGGSSMWAIYDAANTQPIAEFNEGGQVDINNGVLDMNSNQIANLQNPDSAQDAATKDYVDSQADSVNDSATQTLNEVLSEGNDANSQAILNIGSGNIDIDGSGAGNIDLNSQEIQNGDIIQSSNFVAGSYSTGSSSVDGGDVWVENDVEVQGDIVGAGGDVAEKINNESKLEPGTVVTISGNMSVDKTGEKHDTEVAGVVSTDPAMVMAKERDGVPIALTGTAEVKVTMENGVIAPGDMLTTSSTPGKAMKCEDLDDCEGSIIGKALEPAEKSQKIKMLISMS